MRILATLFTLWLAGVSFWLAFFKGAYRLETPEVPEPIEEKAA